MILLALIAAAVFLTKKPFTKNGTKKSKEAKRAEIIASYKKELTDVVASCKDDRKTAILKKTELLKKFSLELSTNIFFDKKEIREIIQELASYET